MKYALITPVEGGGFELGIGRYFLGIPDWSTTVRVGIFQAVWTARFAAIRRGIPAECIYID